MTKTKKIIIMSGLVLLLAVTAVFNFVLAGTVSGSADDGGVTTANYFSTYRTERSTTRNEELLQLDPSSRARTRAAAPTKRRWRSNCRSWR